MGEKIPPTDYTGNGQDGKRNCYAKVADESTKKNTATTRLYTTEEKGT